MILLYIFLAYLCAAAVIYIRGYATYGYRIKNTNEEQRKWYGKLFVLTFAVMIVVLGFRHEWVGIDTWNYADHFDRCRMMTDWDAFFEYNKSRNFKEIGYWFCVFVFTRIGLTDCWIRFIFAAISCIPVGVLIYQKSNSFLMSIFIYLAFGQYAFNFSAIRQGLAIGFTVLAILSAERNTFRAFLFVLLASLFHTTALVSIPAIILTRMKVSPLTICIVSASSLMLFLLRDQLMEFFKESLDKSYDGIRVGGKMFSLFLIATAVLQYYYFYKRIHTGRCSESIMFWLSTLTAIVYLFARTSPVYLRLALYYQIALVIAIPNMLRGINDVLQRLIGYWGYVLVGIYFFFTDVCYSYQITPFYFVWQ